MPTGQTSSHAAIASALTPPTTPQSETGGSLPNRLKQMQGSNPLLSNVLGSHQSGGLSNSLNCLASPNSTADQLLTSNGYGSNELLIGQQSVAPTNQEYQSSQSAFSNQPTSFATGELTCDTNLMNHSTHEHTHHLEHLNGEMESSPAGNGFFNSLQGSPGTTNGSFTINNSFNIYNNGYLTNFNPHHATNGSTTNTLTNGLSNGLSSGLSSSLSSGLSSSLSNGSTFMNSNSYNGYLADQANGGSSINSITAWSNRYISSLHQNALNESAGKAIATSNASSPSSLSSSSVSLAPKNGQSTSSSAILNESNSDVFATTGEQLLDLNQHHSHSQTAGLDGHPQFINESNHHHHHSATPFSTQTANQFLLANNQSTADFCAMAYPTGQPANYLYPTWN